MAKINDTTQYPAVSPTGSDTLIGTDATAGNTTKNFTLDAIATFVNGAPASATLDTVCLVGSVTTTGITVGGDLILGGDVPASAADTGTAGTIIADEDYIYICTATDTWKRVAIATW